MALIDDQQKLSSQTAKSTLSSLRLSQRLVILERYLISLTHSMMEEKYKVRWKSPPSPPLSVVDNKRYQNNKLWLNKKVTFKLGINMSFCFQRSAGQ